jgi:hypothetical protein
METKQIQVISRPSREHVIYCEWLAHFSVKGVEEKVVIPRSMVFTLGKAEGVRGMMGR